MTIVRAILAFAAAALAGGCGASSSAPQMPGLVVTDRGPVLAVEDSGTWAFYGIPYAAPPLDALRWAPPQPHERWSQAIYQSGFGPSCVQVSPFDASVTTGREDCLTANIWTPQSATPQSRLPVMVFLYGGGNVTGSAADEWSPGKPMYEGAALAAQAGVVLVTFNFRVGPLGFLADPSLGAPAGNYGLLDQIFLLRWVQRNIGAFGGDRARVMIFGSSSGADDVCDLTASPLARGLFSAAIMESGSCRIVLGRAASLATARNLEQTMGCTTAPDPAACLRAVDAAKITLAIPNSKDIGPSIDGFVLNDVPATVIAEGAHNHVPIVIGSNSDETSGDYYAAYPSGMSEAQLQALALAAMGGNAAMAAQAMAMYPMSDYGGDPRAVVIAATTDANFGCPARVAARSFVRGQSEPVYRYYFTHRVDNSGVWNQRGAWHGLELVMLFRHLQDFDGSYRPSAGEDALSDALDGYWSRFAASGSPDGAGAMAWPSYDAATDSYLQLDEVMRPGQGVRTPQCDFWDPINPR